MSLGPDPIVAATLPGVDKYHLLVIGVDHYAHLSKLSNAVGDAARVADLLTGRYIFERPQQFDDLRSTDTRYQQAGHSTPIPVFNSPQSTCLYNEQVTRDNINTRIYELAGIQGNNRLGENDALLIFIAGHGVYKGSKFFLAMHDSKPDNLTTFLRVDELLSVFNNYPQEKNGRHILLILDTCFAGGAGRGYIAQDSRADKYSRQLLTSCSAEQPADDGFIYHGSAFANALIETLKSNQKRIASIDQVVEAQKQRFEGDATKTDDAQEISLGLMPGVTDGNGSFPFALRDILRPAIGPLCESIIDHLDFDHQRGNLQDYYDDTIDELNIITAQGPNARIHQLLSKVVFKWVASTQGIRFENRLCFVPPAINLDLHGDEEIFSIINKSINMPGTDYGPAQIFQWYIDQMRTSDPLAIGHRHLILRIDFSGAPAKRAGQFERFCIEFTNLYTAWSAKLTENNRREYGKIFVLISDVSAGGLDAYVQDMSEQDLKRSYNFIPFKRNEKIRINHIRTWFAKFNGQTESERVRQLRDRAVFDQWVGNKTYDHDEFVDRFCSYCEFTQQDIDELNSYLYDYNKSSLIYDGKHNP